jgi:hypothetical protein
MQVRDRARKIFAERNGYMPPPLEKDCPPRPADGLCQACHKPVRKFVLHHSHTTGEFVAWVCHGCNVGALSDTHRDDFGQLHSRA